MHDEAERVPVFNLRHPHALDFPLRALLQLLLFGESGDFPENFQGISLRSLPNSAWRTFIASF